MRWLCAVLVAGIIFAQGEGRQIPEFEGDGNPAHDGQPKWCQAHDALGFKANCGKCETMCDPGHAGQEDKRCAVYCRPGACKCNPQCATSMKRKMPAEVAHNGRRD